MIATPDRQVGVARLDDLGVADRRDTSPGGGIGRREEVPVAEQVAGAGVADVVGGHGEAVDPQADLTVGQLLERLGVHLGVADRRAADLQHPVAVDLVAVDLLDDVVVGHTPQHG